MMRRALSTGLRLAMFALFPLVGLAPGAHATWQSYSTSQGLASNAITSMLGDRSGALWFGTNGAGLSRYDGVKWTTFQARDGLLSDRVTSIAQDSSGVMWFGTDRGVSRFDGLAWESFEELGGIRNNPVTAILVDRAGQRWFGTSRGGVARYDGAAWTAFTTLDGLLTNSIVSLAQDSVGKIWAGIEGVGLNSYDGASWSQIEISPPGGNLVGRSIAADRRGTLWISGETSLWNYNGSTWRRVPPSERGVPSTTSSPAQTGQVFVDRDGAVWVIEAARGVSSFDGVRWRYFSKNATSTRDPLPSDDLSAIAQDRDGSLWFGTALDGAVRFDGSNWRTVELNIPSSFYYCVSCGLRDRLGQVWFASQDTLRRFNGSTWTLYRLTPGFGSVASTLEDRNGKLWFGGTIIDPISILPSTAPVSGLSLLQDRLGQIWVGGANGVSRFNGTVVETYSSTNTGGVLLGDRVTSVVEDPSGLLWFAVSGALATFDGSQWRRVRDPSPTVPRIDVLRVDRAGRLWAAGPAGLERRDGGTWTSFPRDVGVAPTLVNSLFEDRFGNLWMGTSDQGVFRFNGNQWGTYSSIDGLAEASVGGIVQDTSGTLWFEHPNRLSRHFPEQRAPRSVFTLRPPAVSTARAQTARFAAAFGESYGVLFSTSFDGGPWSGWSSGDLWSESDLPDGTHELRVLSRDKIGNLESTPAVATFEIDATPPGARLDSPGSREVVRDSIVVTGAAADPRLREYRVEVRASGIADWDPAHVTLLTRSTSPVAGGALAGWNTRDFRDGGYDLRLLVSDTLGLAAAVTISVIVDNRFPGADHTSPALVRELTGGDVYTTHGETHLYFPPHAFAEDAMVTMTGLPADSVPAVLPSGAVKVIDGFELSWGSSLEKPARFEISTAELAPSPGPLAIYFSVAGSGWTRLGGTFEEGARRLTLAVTRPGRYAVFSDTGTPAGDGGLGSVSFTPRVFSPSGRFADREVGIGFTLGRAAPVTVRVYSLSGRLIRAVAVGQSMGAGQNLVRWDGRDRQGVTVRDGMYLVTVEALGRTARSTLVVVQ